MTSHRNILLTTLIFLAFAMFSQSAEVTATFSRATDVPVSAAGYTATGNSVNLTLGFQPLPGTTLTVVRNTSLNFISGNFSNLAQGQAVALNFEGPTYHFIASYFGGSGNDLVLRWAGTHVMSWGDNYNAQLGDNGPYGTDDPPLIPVTAPIAVITTGVLSGKTVISVAAGGSHSLALCSDGTLAAWGGNVQGQLGIGSVMNGSNVPVAVIRSGVLSGKTVIAIAAGRSHSLALCSDGTVAAWGGNFSGQLGNNSTSNSSVPVVVSRTGYLAGRTVISLAAGGSHSLALCSDGTLAAWGGNTQGQLGINNFTGRLVPVEVFRGGVLAEKAVIAVAAGETHTLALCFDNTLTAWGGNAQGQLGNNSTTRSAEPVVVSADGVLVGKTITAVAAGASHSLALSSDNTVVAWGGNAQGQLGNSSTTQSPVPVAVTASGGLSGKIVTAIAGGGTHSLALCSDGTMAAWGGNNNGQLGNNSTIGSPAPVSVSSMPLAPGERFTVISSGIGHNLCLAAPIPAATLAPGTADLAMNAATITLNGTGFSTTPGNNTVAFSNGAAGTVTAATPTSLTVTFSNPPTEIGNLTAVVTVNGYSNRTSVRVATLPGTLAAGFNSAGHVLLTAPGFTAMGSTVNLGLNFAPVTGSTLTVVKNTSQDFIKGTFVNMAQGQAVELGFGDYTYQFVANYFGGSGNDLVLHWASTRVMNWGNNYTAQLGNNSTVDSPQPAAVATAGLLSGKTIIAVSAGEFHSLALCSDGTLAAWGNSYLGQLGNASNEQSPAPVAVTTAGVLSGKTIIAIAAGRAHNLALCSDGTLATWGDNSSGQLGNNTLYNTSNVPVDVTTTGVLTGKTVIAIAAGNSHSLALCSDGTLAAWGSNFLGQLGDNGSTATNIPVPVEVAVKTTWALTGRTIIAIAAGGDHTLALCSDGQLVAWGSNSFGQLGNDSPFHTYTQPVPVFASGILSGKTIIAIAAGSSHSLALCSDGTLAAWGYNYYGGLGSNSPDGSLRPVAVTRTGFLSARTVTALAAGSAHSVAMCSDGTLATWGANSEGQLGNNKTTDSMVPVAVGTSTLAIGERFVATASGAQHNLGLVSRPPAITLTPSSQALAAGAATLTINGAGFAITPGNNLVTFSHGATGTVTATTPASLTVTFTTQPTGIGNLTAVVTSNGLSSGPAVQVATLPGALTASFSAPSDIPLTAYGFTATGSHVNLSLSHAPTTTLTVVENTSMNFITGTFGNLVQGQTVALDFGGSTYPFVADYFGGSGNDLVLHWAGTRVMNWGTNGGGGRLGNNSTMDSPVPVAPTTTGVLSGKTVIAVAADGYGGHSLALCSDGTLAAWGNNSSGQLGNNSTTSTSVPVAVTTIGVLSGKTIIAIATGAAHSLILCSDGTLATWGINAHAQLGIGFRDYGFTTAPVVVTATGVLLGKTVIAIAAGGFHNLALCSDGTLAAWGSNSDGQLGDNSLTNSSVAVAHSAVPVAVNTTGVLSGKTITSISVGAYHSLALCSDGTLAVWGSNYSGQLGNNSSTYSAVPVAAATTGVLSGKAIVSVAAGGSHTLAQCSDGTLAAWGANDSGQLGSSSSANSFVPVAVSLTGVLSGKNVTGMAAGSSNSMALCSDGTLAAWGSNTSGQLGNNSNVQSHVPVAVSTSPLAPGERFVAIASATSYSLSLVAPVPPSPNADLAAVTLSAGLYAPGFTAGTTTGYSLRVPNAITGTTLTVTPAEASAALEVQLNHGGFNPLPTGIASNSLNLNTGVNAIEVKVTAQDGMATKTYTFTVTRRTILDDWHLAAFATSENTGNLALTADFDNDGKNNLLEFAVGTNPTLNDPSPLVYTGSPAGGGVITATGLPVILPALEETGPGFRALFVRRKDYSAAGLIYTPQFSVDLSTWPNSIDTPTVLADDGTHQIVSVPYPQFISSGPARFFRLSITIAP